MAARLSPGDLVRRKYHISRLNWSFAELGFVLHRDNNGFLDVLWGNKVEHMWDDYDLVQVDEG